MHKLLLLPNTIYLQVCENIVFLFEKKNIYFLGFINQKTFIRISAHLNLLTIFEKNSV